MSANKTDAITPFLVMEILEKAQQMEKKGANIIHLEIGEPDFNIPKPVSAAITEALNQGNTHYTSSLGIIELREEIAKQYANQYKVSVNPQQIIVTSGTSTALLLILGSLIKEKDEVIISDPHYACYPNFIKFLNAKPVSIKVYEENGFQYKPEAIKKKITEKTKAIIINSPSNPTGNILEKETMEEIAKFAPPVISDEIYHGLVYEKKAHSILEFTQNAFVLNGFSKLYAMTGLRLGYIIAPQQFVRQIQKLHQNLFICANSAVQKGGIAALTKAKKEADEMKAVYNKRRIYTINRLKQLGFGITVAPQGAFYVFANAKHISTDSYALALDILQKAHVGVAPGIDFGKNGEGYLRFSYANSINNIIEGLDRIEKYLKKSVA
ncbi:MAG: pyridoxal phosphate-dependent aminotransferase [Deltaproteobacteria bacterium]|nr:pyridoxal phosphate-dependent aminotransferase [Deltaproteobacteria bacterium]